jgi:hypothetical protein
MTYSKNALFLMVEEHPTQLIGLIEDGVMDDAELTFVAEALGDAGESRDIVVDTLIKLSEHKSPLVREGAVYGLEGHIDIDKAYKRLVEMAANDDSLGVRDSAIDAIDR